MTGSSIGFRYMLRNATGIICQITLASCYYYYYKLHLRNASLGPRHLRGAEMTVTTAEKGMSLVLGENWRVSARQNANQSAESSTRSDH